MKKVGCFDQFLNSKKCCGVQVQTILVSLYTISTSISHSALNERLTSFLYFSNLFLIFTWLREKCNFSGLLLKKGKKACLQQKWLGKISQSQISCCIPRRAACYVQTCPCKTNKQTKKQKTDQNKRQQLNPKNSEFLILTEIT